MCTPSGYKHNSHPEDLREVLMGLKNSSHTRYKCLWINIHTSFIHNCRNYMNNLMSIDWRMDTQIIVHLYIRALSYKIKYLYYSLTSNFLPRESKSVTWSRKAVKLIIYYCWVKLEKESFLDLTGQHQGSKQPSQYRRSQHYAGSKARYAKWQCLTTHSQGGWENQSASLSAVSSCCSWLQPSPYHKP